MVSHKSMAQTSIAFIHLDSLMGLMPETKAAGLVLKQYYDTLSRQYQEMNKEADDYTQAWVNGEHDKPITDSERVAKRKAITQLYQRLQSWQDTAESLYNKKMEELKLPIRAKAIQAVEEVAKENNFSYVIDTGNYKEGQVLIATDIFNLVADKLGVVPASPKPQ